MGKFVRLIVSSFLLALSFGLQAETSKKIALSFDDAPLGDGAALSGEARTKRLIQSLADADAGPVVFFVTTRHMNKPLGRQRIERYSDAGHLIANHSHSHQWLMKTDTAKYIADIDKAESLLKGFSNRRSWFRFPFLDEGVPLSKRDEVRAALRERSLFNGYVTVDNYDWYIDSKWKQAVRSGTAVNLDALRTVYVEMLTSAVEFYDEVAIEALGRSPTHMLLLHENDVAAFFVGDLIKELRSRGWTIVSPDEAYADPIAGLLPKTLKTRQGHIAGLAVDAGYDATRLNPMAINEDQIDALIERHGVFQAPTD